jgi:predicted  nucleic acid-binding Zn-ribbon protein
MLAQNAASYAQGGFTIKTNEIDTDYTQSKWDAIESRATEQRNLELEKVAEEENSKLPALRIQLEDLKLKNSELEIEINTVTEKISNLTQKEALLGNLPEIEDELTSAKKELTKCLDEQALNNGRQRIAQLQISETETRCLQLRSSINDKFKEEIELLRQQFDDAKSTAEKLKTVQHYKELADKGDELAMLRVIDL